jgi:hypothetical protein
VLRIVLGALGALVLVACVALAACTVASPGRRELADRQLDEAVAVDLAGAAVAQLPPTFHLAGIVNSGGRTWFGGALTSLDLHRDERRLTFRFEQGQHRNMGGHPVNPVLLDVTLLNPDVPDDAWRAATSTTVGAFYPPVDDPARLAAHFAAQRWLPDAREGGTLTRVAATNEGRGDDLVRDPPARWLAIHVDPARGVRVDLWAWQSAYTLDEARALVRRVADGVAPTPALAAHFAGVRTFDARMAERHRQTVARVEAQLAACGIPRLVPDAATVGARCAAHLSASRRDLRVAHRLGSVPLAAAERAPGRPPRFRVADGLAEQGVAMLYWHDASGRWAVEGLQAGIYEDDDRDNALTASLAASMTDRARVTLLRLVHWDLQFHPEAVDVPGFLRESTRLEGALRDGTLLPGVRVDP